METIVVLGVLVAVSGCLQIVCRLRDLMWAHYLLKPLTMVLVIAVAWLLPGAEPGYRRLVLIGLVFSLAGDVFLMLPFDRFRDDLRWREPLVMGTYYSAQWFIACSVAWA